MRPHEPSLSGTALLDGRAAFSAIVGKPLFDAAIQRLGPADAALYEGITPLSWVPVRIVDALITEVARAFGREPVALNALASRTAVERTIRTVWRPFLRITTDAAIVTRAPTMYRRTYSHGTMDVTLVSDRAAQIAVTDWARISDIQIAGLGAGMEAVLSVAGRKNVHVAHRRSASGVLYDLTLR